MKKLFLFYLLFSTLNGYSQEPICLGMAGGSFGFEDPNDSLFINIDTNDTWFIIKPEKQILFSDTPLNNHALITDTSAYYKSNIISSFNFKLCFGEGTFYIINFFHKYDFEQNKDGGIVETSYDNGITWQNIINDTVIQNNIESIVNFYDASDTIVSADNQPGFTGLQSEYLGSGLRFTANHEMDQDTMLLRFTIVTDPIDAHNEGWMLDDFTIGGGYLAIKDHMYNSKLSVYPNPAKDILFIKSEQENITEVTILSLLGETIIEKRGDNISTVNMESLATGCYFIVCRDNKNIYWISKILKG